LTEGADFVLLERDAKFFICKKPISSLNALQLQNFLDENIPFCREKEKGRKLVDFEVFT
jgi:hypothetical protein